MRGLHHHGLAREGRRLSQRPGRLVRRPDLGPVGRGGSLRRVHGLHPALSARGTHPRVARPAGTGARTPTASPPGPRPAGPCRSGPAPARPPWRPSAARATTTDARAVRTRGPQRTCAPPSRTSATEEGSDAEAQQRGNASENLAALATRPRPVTPPIRPPTPKRVALASGRGRRVRPRPGASVPLRVPGPQTLTAAQIRAAVRDS
jgi:hypothetical protein